MDCDSAVLQGRGRGLRRPKEKTVGAPEWYINFVDYLARQNDRS
jgi:hypothetical protein